MFLLRGFVQRVEELVALGYGYLQTLIRLLARFAFPDEPSTSPVRHNTPILSVMTRQPDFTEVWMKVERAKHHFRDLQARYEGFEEDNPYDAIPYDEPDTGDLVHKAKIPEPPPLWWSTIIGDCVHNLRSSLDLLVCEMVRAEDKPVTRHIEFPIFKCAEDFESGYRGKVKGVQQAAVDLIKEAKPYKGADNPFWPLHKLDIEDKHKLLVPIGMVHHSITTTFALDVALDEFFAANPGTTEATMEDVVTPPAGITMLQHRFPLEDGAEIYRVPASLRNDPRAQMHMYPELTIEIAFGEVEVVKGEPLIPTLHQLIQFVEGFIKLFPPLFSQEPS